MEKQISLLELNRQIRNSLQLEFPRSIWVVAEISELNPNRSGHCYLELIEKDSHGQILARSRATIWARTWRMLKPYFEHTAGISLQAEQKVLVNVTIEYHEIYGHSLNILDIDPNYTLGDLSRRRNEIIEKLKQDGVFEMNKEITLPQFIQSIAIISSASAAGYTDFIDQLLKNQYGLKFKTKLFPAIMQGDKAPESIMSAMEEVFNSNSEFDLLVIIRGGGSRSDLNTFDDYNLAFHCTQFPIPIFTGVGHERDESIVDLVAHSALKTPTAVAEYLIHFQHQHQLQLIDLEEVFLSLVKDKLDTENLRLTRIGERFSPQVKSILQRQRHQLEVNQQHLFNFSRNLIKSHQNKLQNASQSIPHLLALRTQHQLNILENYKTRLIQFSQRKFPLERQKIINYQERLNLLNPEQVVKRGYTLSYQGNTIITSIYQIKQGEKLETLFKDGRIISTIDKTTTNES